MLACNHPDTSPPLWIVDNGAAVMVAHVKGVYEKLESAGYTIYPTLAGAVLHGGVQASAFDRAIKAEPVYDATKALAAGSVKDLDPVGVRATYRIVADENGFHHPPRWPS